MAQQELIGVKPMLLEWAQRTSGLVAATGISHIGQRLTDLRENTLHLADREQTAGSYLLFSRLIRRRRSIEKQILCSTRPRHDYLEPSFQRLRTVTRIPRCIE